MSSSNRRPPGERASLLKRPGQRLCRVAARLRPRNRQLLQVHEEFQSRIDQYHRDRSGDPLDLGDYERFWVTSALFCPKGTILLSATNVDDEIAGIAGPQLVVPLSNARYALNAANARWGSLYDALYGTECHPGGWQRYPHR
jgi:malate synthase